ncbi:hypothetical protein OUZ56_015380 [Daphnia magna]|uniref:Uncharacterized protein n=1 Tax=Daphnia magna TaxID=35525 RepID=A0ABR0AMM6_9CRUS|nr:hypothetical protein OUZ56_015380 [Daphnia magna]
MKFGFRWIKRWVRSRSSPIPFEKAEVWERRFAFAYFFAAWNLLAYLGYNYYKNKKMGVKMIEDGETLAEKMARRANMQNVTIYRDLFALISIAEVVAVQWDIVRNSKVLP